MMISYVGIKIRSTEEAVRGPQYAHVHQYNPRSVASRVVLMELGRIEGRGRSLRCFLILLSD